MNKRQIKILPSITQRTPNLERYLSEVSKQEMVSANEEVDLARKIKQGDEIAAEKLCKANLRFVISIAKQYENKGLPLPDLINEGNLGLIKAVHLFDETRGFKFITYAVWWIRQNIRKALTDFSRTVRLPDNKVALLDRFRDAQSFLAQQLQRDASDSEICEFMGINKDDYMHMVNFSTKGYSLDSPFGEDESKTLHDILTDDDNEADQNVQIQTLRSHLFSAMKCLTPQEKRIILYWSGFSQDGTAMAPMSHVEIGHIENLTGERIRQIKNKALLKLRKQKLIIQLHYAN